MLPFSNVYEDDERAQAYAALDFPGTYSLAFRDIPALVATHVHGALALDFGCGAGRSTRFLERLGFRTIGIDISGAMLERARALDPGGDYRLVTPESLAALPVRFNLIFAAFTFDNIPTDAAKLAALRALKALLAPGGFVIAVVSTPALYLHEWASFSTQAFPENRHAGDGDVVRIVMLDVPDRRPIDDVVCSDARYRELFASAGLGVREAVQPLATGMEPIAWVSETHVAAWSLYVLDAMEPCPPIAQLPNAADRRDV
jgi:SAM-dependent methyltransferase